MKQTILLAIIVMVNSFVVSSQIKINHLKCEYLTNPDGIDMADPRFFWQLVSDENNQFQTAYQLIVATSAENVDRNIGDAFDSEKIKSCHSTQIVYNGKKLKAASTYFWKVRAWDKNGKASDWSETARFSTGLLGNEDWKNAQWIAWKPQEKWETDWWKRKEVELGCIEVSLPNYFGAKMNMWEKYNFNADNRYDPAPLYRKEFKINKQVKGAKAYISGLGYFELFVNGSRVGDHVLDPGWTDYSKTILYVAHDVTSLFQQGSNAIGVMLGRGNYGQTAIDHWDFYKKGGYIGQPKLMCRFKITYTDGTEDNIVSDLSWKVTGGPILYDCPRMGELYDATKEIEGWNKSGLNDADWDKVQPAPVPGGEMKAQLCEPIRVVKKFKPVKVEKRGRVTWIDAGTNLAGWIRLRVNAPKGTRIGIYYGENENPQDNGQAGGYQQMGYVAKGTKNEFAECHFSYKGFRYVNIVGYPGNLKAEDIEVCQVNTDVETVGSFSSSDSTLNGIHRICTRSMISNLHSIPTDCPHREKNGWMGDATTGMEYGMANYDLAALMTKFTRDMFDTQDSIGLMGSIAPTSKGKKGGSPLWSSACIHVPWYMYSYYGDTWLFVNYWDKMKLFTQAVWKYKGVAGKPGIFTDVFADWCSPHGNIGEEGVEVYTTMNFFLVLKRLSKMAEILGKKKDVIEYNNQAERVRNAIYKYCFNEKQVIFGGIKPSDYRQGPNAMALLYGIVKPEHQKAMLDSLVNDVAVNRKNHFYGGIFTGYALYALMPTTGNAQLTYDVSVNDTYPGYGFMLKKGATSLWEHWEDNASHIHHFMGFVDNFLIRNVAGINSDFDSPGFSVINIEPEFVEGVNQASASYNSIHGLINVDWQRNVGRNFTLNVKIPVNCTARVILPESSKEIVVNGVLQKTNLLQFKNAIDKKPKKNFTIDSGNYKIEIK